MPSPSRRTFLTWLSAAPLAPHLLAACDGGAASGAGDAIDAADTTDTAAVVDVADVADSAPSADTAGPDAAPTTCAPTRPDAEGPFFRPNAPSDAALAGADEPGDRLAVSGRVLDSACRPIAGATVEVWQADVDGDYHDDRLRGVLTTDAEGRYAFTSIVPGRYFQANGYRPAHLHYKVHAPGFRLVTTQIYFEGDPFLAPNDSCGGCGSGDDDRIIPLVVDRAGVYVGAYDPVLAAV